MVASSDLPGCLPEWVRSLATPVWVSDPAGNIGYLNGHAASTLGVEAESCLGRPCYEVLAGRDEQGRLHCRANCPVLAEVLDRQQVEPFRLSLHDGGKTPRWLWILVLTIHDDGGPRPWLVHLAVPCDRSHRIETYVTKVASRSSKTPRRTGADRLTRRECEVLTLLAEDHDLNRIANELCISYTTVRNHVQHILTKLHVHSIVEAVACHLVKKQGDKD